MVKLNQQIKKGVFKRFMLLSVAKEEKGFVDGTHMQ